jgi:hypothetical protein
MQGIAVLHQWNMLRRLVLLGTPLVFGILELGHPLLDYKNPIHMLAPITTQWIVLHLLFIPLYVFIGWAFYLLLQDIPGRAAIVSRCAIVIYVAYAIGYDTVVGLNSGLLVRNALSLSIVQQLVIQHAMQQLFTDPMIILCSLIISIAGAVAVFAAAWALFRAGVPRFPIVILLGVLLLVYSHAAPFGPLGNASFFIAALWIELVWRIRPQRESDALAISSAVHTPGSPMANISSREQV